LVHLVNSVLVVLDLVDGLGPGCFDAFLACYALKHALKFKHLAFDPVPHVFEGVAYLSRRVYKFLLEVNFGISCHDLHGEWVGRFSLFGILLLVFHE
jgi:hypothetical protein